jgi:hypothetical protein
MTFFKRSFTSVPDNGRGRACSERSTSSRLPAGLPGQRTRYRGRLGDQRPGCRISDSRRGYAAPPDPPPDHTVHPGRAECGSRERIAEPHAAGGQCIDVFGMRVAIAVAAQGPCAVIVGHNHRHVQRPLHRSANRSTRGDAAYSKSLRVIDYRTLAEFPDAR